MDPKDIKPGQRWVSDAEPELGLGVVMSAGYGRVAILFPAAEERREYALESAPVRRVAFEVGDTIKTHEGVSGTVEDVKEEGGFLNYQVDGTWIPEAALADTISFSSPVDRLQGGQFDEAYLFQIRNEALEWQSKIRKAPNRGFTGGRIDLIEHQLYIAQEVSSRLKPRVLLADEVGLGKTIEACLILHRLHLTGRAERTLIVLPESLMHQWFIELMRRFNLMASLFDEERCKAIEASAPETNPFLDSQIICVSLDYLTEATERFAQVLEVEWDLLIVDEAHHLEWTPDKASIAYKAVEALAKQIPSVLLLTATPQQLGPEGHFARLRLLDPVRYNDLDTFAAESEHYTEAAELVDRIESGDTLKKADWTTIKQSSPYLHETYSKKKSLSSADREELAADMIDSFGPGRVMFRNTRKALSGFPVREPYLYPLENTGKKSLFFDTKLEWLVDWLKANPESKALLICKTKPLVEKLAKTIQEQININLGQFHEGLTLLQRDRQAAYFSDPEGARLLICSEIGSEGRNFQFAHHLILWDLPENPELVEQRIGRLDRIGQTETIKIHVPYIEKSAEQVWAQFYKEGVGAFDGPVPTALRLASAFEDDLQSLSEKFKADKLDNVIEAAATLREELGEQLEKGYLRLLARNSFKAGESGALRNEIADSDADKNFEDFYVSLMEFVGVRVEDLGDRRYIFKPEYGHVDTLPGLDPEGMMATFERKDALSREDVHFFTTDHPLLRSALDSLVSSEKGNTAISVFKEAEEPGIYLQATALVECVAPKDLHIDRYLPITPINLWINHRGHSIEMPDLADAELDRDPDTDQMLSNSAIKGLIKRMSKSAEIEAKEIADSMVEEARIDMKTELKAEITRLSNLTRLNPDVGEEEIQSLAAHQLALDSALSETRIRLDSLHLVICEE
ncbi:MAG: SNF2-related protein [Opitutales bacterium]